MNLDDPQQCIASFQSVRGSQIEAMMRLAAVFAANTWKDKAVSWSEFVESDLQISQSAASKLLRVHEAYLLSGTTTSAQLEGTDIEKLYLAIPLLKENPKGEVIEQARLLSRAELKESIHEAKHGPHTHQFDEKRYGKCYVCKGYHLV